MTGLRALPSHSNLLGTNRKIARNEFMGSTMNDCLCSVIDRQTISDVSSGLDTPHAIWRYNARDIAMERMTLSTTTDKT
ncbi:MAG: hypothetical protein MJY59_05175, partial [Bacteroidaceae bacterium]|nr:hypothetical protein [Bacteroidaceae bacterium]